MKKELLFVLSGVLLLSSCTTMKKFFNATDGVMEVNYASKMEKKLPKKTTVSNFLTYQSPLKPYNRIGECFVQPEGVLRSESENLKMPENPSSFCRIYSLPNYKTLNDVGYVPCDKPIDLADLMVKAIKTGQCEKKEVK